MQPFNREVNGILESLLKILNAMANFLANLSFGEFIIIWTSTLMVVLFYLWLLFYIIRIERDLKLLKIKLKEIYGWLKGDMTY